MWCAGSLYACSWWKLSINKNLLILKDIYIKVGVCVCVWVFGIHKHKQHACECAMDARGCLFRTKYMSGTEKNACQGGIEEWEFTLRKKKYILLIVENIVEYTHEAHTYKHTVGGGGVGLVRWWWMATYWILFSFILANFLRKKKVVWKCRFWYR